ncbi:proline dehydrogenase 1, mitochondrial-like [Corticium candelabrum]|uniref:proline dehydrogenase 1, mitochondrial-like n=1 Tax=Corticium candelabrum TaxID=121492 RepID=UPI002E25C288|nr:proline dehydrogenase 1, mitochondrial-like [Corticium candelabrum]
MSLVTKSRRLAKTCCRLLRFKRCQRVALRGITARAAAIDFEDTETAYANITSDKLRRSLLVLRLSSLDAFADRSLELMNIGERILPERLYEALMRRTFYGQFIAGETEEELLKTTERFLAMGVRSIPQNTLENELTEQEVLATDLSAVAEKPLEDNAIIIQKNTATGEKLAQVGGQTDHSNTKVVFKMSAIVHPKLLTRLSSAICSDGQFPVVTAVELEALMEKAAYAGGYIDLYTKAVDRLDRLIQDVEARKLSVLIDAEYSYMQPAIRALALYMQSKYNKQRPLVYNTEQAYLKEAVEVNKTNLRISDLSAFQYATKVVRGAYMDSERVLAKRTKTPDPIHATYEDTNVAYDRVVNALLQRAALSEAGVLVATHNESSVGYAVGRMQELGIDRQNGTVSFAQLMGLCDHVTFRLGRDGYLAYKVVHYGNIKSTLPFLCRRAQENRMVSKGFRREQALIQKELSRRQTLT